MDRTGAVQVKSYAFAVEMIKTIRSIQRDTREFVVTRQCLRAGTSIGANIEEASAAQSRRDFIAKMAVASKEARETRYWLRLLKDTGLLHASKADRLLAETQQLIRLLTAIVTTTQLKTEH